MTATEDAISSQMVSAVDHLGHNAASAVCRRVSEREGGGYRSHSSVLNLEFRAENLLGPCNLI